MLDSTFGTGGLASGAYIAFNDVAIQADGKIVVGGTFDLQRFNANGTVDTSFGQKGLIGTDIGKDLIKVWALAIQNDGKIVVVGQARSTTQDSAIGIARYNSNGVLDSTFGSKGFVVTNVGIGGDDLPFDVAIQADNKIVVAGGARQGTNPYAFGLVRYNANGSLDTSFNGTGIVTTSISNSSDRALALAIQPDGNIVVAGYADVSPGVNIIHQMAVARYIGSGALAGHLDASFGTNGVVEGLSPAGTDMSFLQGVLVQSNGDIVTAGYSCDSSSISQTMTQTVTRLQSNGSLDTTFGVAPNLGFALNSTLYTGEGGIMQAADGDLLVAGSAGDPAGFGGVTQDLGVAAYLPSGLPDTTFGTSGAGRALSAGIDYAGGMAIQPDGKIVVAGSKYSTSGSLQPGLLARFQAPNTKITSFNVSPNPVVVGGSVTLSASGILNSNPTSTIAQVTFFYVNNSGTTVVLSATQTSPGVWSCTAPSGLGLTTGTYTLTAQARDSNGAVSDPLAISFTVL
jgi:uncharacterized delta-60 repeat protein